MGTTPNAAAIYRRHSAVDARNAEANTAPRNLTALLPLAGQQVATILGVVAVLTGERAVRKVWASRPNWRGWGRRRRTWHRCQRHPMSSSAGAGPEGTG